MLITYDTGGSRDFAIDGKTALVADHSIQGLEACLRRALSDKELRRAIREEGQIYARSLPGWDERTDQLEAILKSYARL
jgi:glycosyltransferase involved in cell wall biosynthesis